MEIENLVMLGLPKSDDDNRPVRKELTEQLAKYFHEIGKLLYL